MWLRRRGDRLVLCKLITVASYGYGEEFSAHVH